MTIDADMEAAGAPEPTLLGLLASVAFSGPDARSFLQGQLTNDIHNLDGGGWQFSGLCNPKGRMLCSFVLFRGGDEEYVALMERGLAGGFCAHISKYVMRAKVRIAPQPGSAVRFLPAASAAAGQLRTEGGTSVAAGVGGTDLYLDPEGTPGEGPSEGADARWKLLQIERGIPWISERTRELFIAQSVNFDLLGGISFTKGCYIGQEIVARMHYRGTPKQRMFRAQGAGAPPAEGSPLYSARYGEQTAGHVVNSAASGDGFAALVCMRIDAAGEACRTEAGGGQEMHLAEIKY